MATKRPPSRKPPVCVADATGRLRGGAGGRAIARLTETDRKRVLELVQNFMVYVKWKKGKADD